MGNDRVIRKLSRTKMIVFSLITSFIILLILEGSIRVWVYFLRGQYEVYDTSSETFELVPGEYKMGRAILAINSDGFVGEELGDLENSSLNILALGDSCTFGDGNSSNTYSRLLEQKYLGAGMNVNVINGGVEGLNSTMALKRLRAKGGMTVPDVVLIYIGWNDLMKSGVRSQAQGAALSNLAGALDKLWLVKGMRKAVFFYARPHMAPPGIGEEGYRGDLKSFEPGAFTDNLHELISETRLLGAEAVLVTLPTALGSNMSAADLKDSNIVFPYFTEAYSVLDFLDLISAYNASIRQVAAEEQVTLIDLAALFEALPDKSQYFYDTMHPSLIGREYIADILYESFGVSVDDAK